MFLLLVFVANAQESLLIGSWLITKAEVCGEVKNPYFITEFKADGNFLVMGIEAGTWKYNKASMTIILKSELDKDFNGEGKILNLTEEELVVDKDGAKFFYQKVNNSQIAASNKTSGLMGLWEFKDVPHTGVNTLVTFTEPDEFMILQKEENSEARLSGTWIFDETEMSLIMIGLRSEDIFKGESKILKITDGVLELENDETVFKAQQKEQSTEKIVRLTFTEGDFYTEGGDYKYYSDEEKLPWSNWSEMKMALLDVNHLVYNYSTLINGTEAFESKSLTADVKASLEEEGFTIDNIFEGYDRYNLPENSEFPENPNFNEPLYPLVENTFRVVGKEQITTPAGSFNCTVLEVVRDSETLKKLWMINDKIGVYAKIIEDNPDETFGHYCIYELQEIR